MTTTGAVIQARMGSSRLPGKVLMDLGGTPVLLHIINRLKLVPELQKIVVATSREPQDDTIAQHCREWGVLVYRGDERDVLDRCWRAAALHRMKTVVRITADCPLLDPMVVSAVIQRHRAGKLDYCSNVFAAGQPRPTFPDGLDCEVMTITALDAAWNEAGALYDREHVTPYLWSQPGRFLSDIVSSTGNYGNLRWTLDTPEDLERIRGLMDRLPPGETDYRLLLDRR